MLPQEAYLDHLAKLIEAIGRAGESILVGRGAGFLLPRETTLSLRIIAPLRIRAMRLAERMGVSVRTARRAARDLDRRRAQFDRTMHRMVSADPHNYDMVLDTHSLGLDIAVEVIARAVEAGRPGAPAVPATPCGTSPRETSAQVRRSRALRPPPRRCGFLSADLPTRNGDPPRRDRDRSDRVSRGNPGSPGQAGACKRTGIDRRRRCGSPVLAATLAKLNFRSSGKLQRRRIQMHDSANGAPHASRRDFLTTSATTVVAGAAPRTRHRHAELRGRGTHHPHCPGRLRRPRHRRRDPGPQHQGANPAGRHGRRLRRPAQEQLRPAQPAVLTPDRRSPRPAVPRYRRLPQGDRLRRPGRRRPAGHAAGLPANPRRIRRV